MSNVAISVKSLGKRYEIGCIQQRHDTLVDALAAGFRAPWERLRRRDKVAEEGILWALRDVSFEMSSGTVMGFIGRNGAGKSTLLKILCRITKPTEGRAVVRGRVGALLEVGTGFHRELTGRENVYLNGAVLGMRKHEIDRKFDEIVDFSGVEKFIDTPVKHYSSGMNVRLAFAVAAHLEPEVLLVDEVLAVGDAEFQARCLGKMQSVTGEGRTVLFVSHNMSAITFLCESVMWIDQGTVRMHGEPTAVVQSYLSSNAQRAALVHFEDDLGKLAQITQVELGHHNVPAVDFEVTSPIRVKINYRVRELLIGCRLGVAVHRYDGVEVLRSFSNDENGKVEKTLPGEYIAMLLIPARLLAPGRYFVSFYLDQPPAKVHDRHENIIDFDVLGNPFKINRKHSACLGCFFQWETSLISDLQVDDSLHKEIL